MHDELKTAGRNDKPILYYVYDPLCGWCYGFSPVINKISKTFQQEIEIEVISGGMMLHDRVGPVSEVAPYIKSAYKRVEEMTGVKFGEPYLKDLLGEGKTIMDSWYLCLALTFFKTILPDQQLEFATALQKAVYFEGIEPQDIVSISKLASSFGIDAVSFMADMNSEEMKYATSQEFQFAQDLSATGFPTLILKVGETYYLMARGYVNYETLNSRINSALQPVMD